VPRTRKTDQDPTLSQAATRRRRSPASILWTVVALAACATPPLPSITPEPTNERHIGQFVWRDLLTTDLAAAQAFYGGLFGWTFSPTGDSKYVLASLHGRPMAGMADVSGEADVNSSQWVSWISVSDVDEATATTVSAGGSVIRGPKDRPNRGRFAVVAGPTGALVVLVVPQGGDPINREAEVGDWLWQELWTDDTETALSYYGQLAGYTQEQADGGIEQDYFVLETEGEPRAGVTMIPWDWVSPNWLPYIRVDDAQAYAQRAEPLGGRVLFAPRSDVRQGTTAIIVDPTGAGFALQQWPVPERGRNR